jgi:tRNA-modifying protein YgfZ
LLLPAALQPAIQKRLGMFVLRAKVTLNDVSNSLMRFAIVAEATEPVDISTLQLNSDASPMESMRIRTLTVGGNLIRLSATRAIIVAEFDAALVHWQALANNAAPAGAHVWDLTNIRAGTIDITPETQDAYVPQMANFELSGGVSFKKGCYPGQEIVARTQYRGILKRRMQRVTFQLDSAPVPGTPIYSPDFPDQAVGSIALAARTNSGDDIEALVIAQIESHRNQSLFLDAELTQPLAMLSLPYAVPLG